MRTPQWFGLLFWVLAALHAEAGPSLTVFPSSISAKAIQEGNATARTILVTLDSGSNRIDLTTLALSLDFYVTLKLQPDAERVMPHGFVFYQDVICHAYRCLRAVSPSSFSINFLRESEYDISSTETILIQVKAEVFYGESSDVQAGLQIVPVEPVMNSLSIILSAPFVIVNLVNSVLLPSSFDLPIFLLSSKGTCVWSEDRVLLPGSLFALLPLGGNSIFEMSWRVMVGVVVLVFFLFLLIEVRRVFSARCSLILVSVKLLFPLLTAQLCFYVMPGLAFASGSMTFSLEPFYQVFGFFMLIIILFIFFALHGWLLRNSQWEFTKDEEEEQRARLRAKTCGSKFRHYVLPTGTWLNLEIVHISEPDTDGDRVVTFIDRFVMPRDFDGGRRIKKVMALFYLMNIAQFYVAGVSPKSPQTCFLQFVGIAVSYVLTALFVWRTRLFRSKVITTGAILIRVFAALIFLIMSLRPSDFRTMMVYIVLSCALAIAMLRFVVYGMILFNEPVSLVIQGDASTVATKQTPQSTQGMLQAPLLEVQQQEVGVTPKALQTDLAAPTVAQLAPPSAAPTKKEELDLASTCRSTEDPLARSGAEAAPDEKKTVGFREEVEEILPIANATADVETRWERAASTFSEDSNLSFAMLEEGKSDWLARAAKTKPRCRPEDTVISRQPLWFPKERPHLRLHNLPDLPLRVQDFKVSQRKL